MPGAVVSGVADREKPSQQAQSQKVINRRNVWLWGTLKTYFVSLIVASGNRVNYWNAYMPNPVGVACL